MTLFMFWCLSGHLPLARSSTVSIDHAADRRRQVLTDFFGGIPWRQHGGFNSYLLYNVIHYVPSGYLT